MRSGKVGVGGDVEPELVHKLDILRTQPRIVRADGVLAHSSIRGTDFQRHAWSRLSHALPGIARHFRLFVGSELVRKTADYANGIEPLCGNHNRFEYIGRWNHKERNGLSFLFRDGHRRGEKFLLVMVKDLGRFHHGTAAEAWLAMVEAGAHHDDILLYRVGVAENMAEVVQVAWIAHRNQNVSRAHPHGSAAQLLIAIDAELVKLLRFAVALPGNMPLGEGEDGKEHTAENDSGDGGLVLGKKIHHRGKQQHCGD